MPEVREQAPHAATLRVQRRKIGERNLFHGVCSRRLRVHTSFLRLPLIPIYLRREIWDCAGKIPIRKTRED
jgi:hypothetical protein